MANFSRFSGGGGRMAIPALGATAITGAYFYYRSGANNKDVGGQAARSRNKRENEGLTGAGIGNNRISGGHEAGQVGSRTQPGTGDVERRVNTTADSTEKLPGGGADGGPDTSTNLSRGVRRVDEAVNAAKDAVTGAGSENDSSSPARERAAANFDVGRRNDIDAEASTTDKKATRGTYPSSSSDHRPQGKVESSESGISQKLQGVFGQGGKGSGEPEEATRKFSNPKIDSNHADTPSKRGQLRSDS